MFDHDEDWFPDIDDTTPTEDPPDRFTYLHQQVDADRIAVGDLVPIVITSTTENFMDHYEIALGHVLVVSDASVVCILVGKVLSTKTSGLSPGDVVSLPRRYQTTVAEHLPSDGDMDGVVVTVDRREQEHRAHAALSADAEFTTANVDWED